MTRSLDSSSTVKPRGKYVFEYFKVGDKVEVLEGSTLGFYGVKLGDILEVRSFWGYNSLVIDGERYQGDQLVLRKVNTSKKGLCKFLDKVREDYEK